MEVTISQAAVLVLTSNLIKCPALKIQVRLLKCKSYRKETETGFKTDALKSVWFVGPNRKLLMFTVKFEVECFAGVDEKTQQPPVLGTKKYCMPALQ